MKAKQDYENSPKQVSVQATNIQQARKISWIVTLIIIILSVFIAIVCTAIYTKQPDLPIEYDYVIRNWSYEPIHSITPSANGCEEYFTGYDFPGSVEGCDCRTSPSAKYGNSIYAGQCTTEQSSNGCKIINSTAQTFFDKWRLQSQILQLCIKRISGFNYMKSDCSIVGYRRCGVNQGDTTNVNMFCLPSQTQCPVNSIVYGAAAPDINYISIIDVGGQKIFTSNQLIDSQPLAFSRISRGNGECKDYKSYHYVDPNMKEYELTRGMENTCTSDQTDPRFKYLFQINESDYITANNYDSKISNLPSYPLSQNMQYYLLTRSYIPWNQLGECRYTHMPFFIDMKTKTDKVSSLWVGCIIVNWLVAVLFGGLASVLRLKLQWKIKNWVIIPAAILLLSQTVMTIVTFGYAADTNKNIKEMKDAKCSDEQTNNIISTFSDDFNSSVLTFQIVLLIFVLVLNIFTLFFMSTIFIIVRDGSQKEAVLPISNGQTNKNKGNSGKNKEYDNDLLEDRGQILGGFDNTYQPNGNPDGNTMYAQNEIGSDGYSNMNTHLNNNGNTIQQSTVSIPLIVKANEDQDQSKQKGVLKKGGQQQPNKSVQIIQQNGQNGNMKVTKFDDDHYNQQFEKNKELENLYASNPNTLQTAGKNTSQVSINNKSAAFNNNQSGKQTTGKTIETISEDNNDEKYKFNTVRDNKNKSEMQLQIIQNNNSKSFNNISHFTPSPAKVIEPVIVKDQQAIESLVNMENLLDNNEWEFEIDDYVKKHREKLQSHNRIGGGYEIGKPREKYLHHKFQKSHTRKIQSGNSIEFDQELASPEKLKQTQNLISPHITQNNFGSDATLNAPLYGNITENAEETESQQEDAKKLP